MAAPGQPDLFADRAPGQGTDDLRDRAIQGGVAMLGARGLGQLLRLLITANLARILSPDDFGLVAIVLAVVGIAGLFQDMGLSAATVQRAQITPQQVSTLFWINAGMGAMVCVIAVALSPLLADFYKRPELASIAAALSLSFFLSGLMVQHNALLYRARLFTLRARIGITAMLVAGAVSLWLARAGAGPWSLVVQTVLADLISLLLVWRATHFRVQAFAWNPEVKQMIGFGGQFFLFRLLGYFAQNLQVVLIGRELGAATAALFTRADMLNRQLLGYANETAGPIANASLPRLVKEPERFVRFYLRALAVIFFATAPIALFLGVFAHDVILFLFGPKWEWSATVLTILMPGMLAQPLLYSTGWVFFAHADVSRMLRWGMFGWSVMIGASIVGLRWGVTGVAWGWSAGMLGLMAPCVLYAFRGRGISLTACLGVMWQPLAAAVLAAAIAREFALLLADGSVFLRLPLEGAVFGLAYLILAWSLFGQKPLIMQVIQSLRKGKPPAVTP